MNFSLHGVSDESTASKTLYEKKLDFTEFITKVNAIFGYPALEIKLAEYVLFDLL